MAAFFLDSVVVGALTPGYSPVQDQISSLAAADKELAPVMIAGFLAASIGVTATGIALWRRLSRAETGRVAGRIGAVLVVLSGALMTVAGLAQQDCSERLTSCIDHGEALQASGSYWVHQFASLALFLLLSVAMFFLARGIRDSAWSRLAVPTRLAGLWGLVTIAAIVVGPSAVESHFGIAQRAFLLVVFGWPVVLAAVAGDRESGQA